jgi:CO dehydrogenase maturation factor
MKIAVAGKGGSGKTTLAGTLARLLGRRGQAVLAIDADTNPNLAITLGIPREAAAQIHPVPQEEIMEERVDASGKKLRALAIPPKDVITRYGVPAADNTTLLLMGRVDHGGVG